MTWMPMAGDPHAVRQRADRARLQLVHLPPGSGQRRELEVWIDLDELLTSVSGGEWQPDDDARLARLEAAAAEPPPGLDDHVSPMLRVQTVLLRGMRLVATPSDGRPEQERSADLDRAIADTEAALNEVRTAPGPASSAQGHLHAVAGMLLVLRAGAIDEERDTALLDRAQEHLRHAPPEQRQQLEQVLALARSGAEGSLDPDHLERLGGGHQEFLDIGGLDLLRLRELTTRAQRDRDPRDIDAAIDQLKAFRRRLPAGHPLLGEVLGALATLLGLRAVLTSNTDDAAQALDAAIVLAETSPRADRSSVQPLYNALTFTNAVDLREGPFLRAEHVLDELVARGAPEQPMDRHMTAAALGAARALAWRGTSDPAQLDRARRALDEAEQLLPDDDSLESLQAAFALLQINLLNAMLWGDRPGSDAGRRQIDKLEQRLRASPHHAQALSGMTMPGAPNPFGNGADGVIGMLAQMRRLLDMLAMLPTFDGGPGGSTAWGLLQSARAQTTGGAGARDPRGMWEAALGQMAGRPEQVRTGLGKAAGTDIPEPPAPAAETEQAARAAIARMTRFVPTLADALTGSPHSRPAGRRPLSRDDRPEAGELTTLMRQLRTALDGALSDDRLRRAVRAALALCMAELHWAGATSGNARHLAATVSTLEDVVSGGDRRAPTVLQADLLDVLARCQREQARLGHATRRGGAVADEVRTARASLRELGRCVLLANTPDTALELAGLAADAVHRLVSWCLADGRPEQAVEAAEAGRALVLASTVLSGRVSQLLQVQGRADLAGGWAEGDEQARLEALRVISESPQGLMTFATPTYEDVTLAAQAAGLDAVVLLVPPAPGDGVGPGEEPREDVGHAVLVRMNARIEVLQLPGLRVGPESELGRYVAALDALLDAVAEPDEDRDDAWLLKGAGLRGSPEGLAWSAALHTLGRRMHEMVVAPLVAATTRWGLGRVPHVALVPLDVLGVVPFAAACTPDPDQPGGLRYAVHDLVLTTAASARLLGRAARRGRLPLGQRVVLVSDPDGGLPLARLAAEEVATHLRPDAVRYGPDEPDGPATAQRVLAAVLGSADEPPASLLHLATHADAAVTATRSSLLLEGEHLALAALLDAGAARAADAPGGLVVCDACVTDTVRHDHDESLTLSTTFLAAGARGVIGTRWPVDDDAAATMAYLLHTELLRQPTAAQALRAAQLAMIEGRLPEHMPPLLRRPTYPGRQAEPASWAAYVYHGA